VISIIDNPFPTVTTGNVAVVVAGTRAEDTRMATTVLQQYDTLLVGQTASAVKVTSLATTGITPL
jgi:hypothetical protein